MGYKPASPTAPTVQVYLGVVVLATLHWVLQEHCVESGSVKVDWSLTSPDSAEVTFRAIAGSIAVHAQQPIKITISGSPRDFGGVIDSIDKVCKPGSGRVWYSAKCVSWDRLLTRRRAWYHEYVNQTLGDIISSLILNSLNGDNLSAVVIPGPVIDSFVSDYSMTVADAIAAVCERATTDSETYYTYVDSGRVLYLSKQSVSPAPWSIDDTAGSDGNALHGDSYQIQGTDSVDKYVNTTIAKASKLIGDSKTQVFHGDGATQSFEVDTPVALPPTVMKYTTTPVLSDSTPQTFVGDGSTKIFTLDHPPTIIESVDVDGVPQSFSTGHYDQYYYDLGNPDVTQAVAMPTLASPQVLTIVYRWDTGTTVDVPTEQSVGVSGVDTGKDFYWADGSTTIVQDSGGSPLTVGQSLSVTFQGYTVGYSKYILQSAVDQTALLDGSLGRYEAYITVDDPITQDALDAKTEAYTRRFGTPPKALSIATMRVGLATGQSLTIHLNDINVDDDYLIDTLSLSLVGGTYCLWSAHAVCGSLAGDIWKAWAALAKGVSTGSAGRAVAAGGSESSDSSVVTVGGVPVTY